MSASIQVSALPLDQRVNCASIGWNLPRPGETRLPGALHKSALSANQIASLKNDRF